MTSSSKVENEECLIIGNYVVRGHARVQYCRIHDLNIIKYNDGFTYRNGILQSFFYNHRLNQLDQNLIFHLRTQILLIAQHQKENPSLYDTELTQEIHDYCTTPNHLILQKINNNGSKSIITHQFKNMIFLRNAYFKNDNQSFNNQDKEFQAFNSKNDP